MLDKYNDFKVENQWGLTNEMCENYLNGIMDFCDSLIQTNSQIVYDISTLRNEVEEKFADVDLEEMEDDQ